MGDLTLSGANGATVKACATENPPMGVVGLCVICGRPALMSCRACGRVICGEHVWEGMCSRCAETRQRRRDGDDVRGPAMMETGSK